MAAADWVAHMAADSQVVHTAAGNRIEADHTVVDSQVEVVHTVVVGSQVEVVHTVAVGSRVEADHTVVVGNLVVVE